MPLASLNDVLIQSVEKKYGVPSIDALDYLFVEAVVSCADENNVPIILSVGDFEGFDSKNMYPYIKERISRAKSGICLHFDHGNSFEACVRAIRNGCTSVMIDGSYLPFEKNIEVTREVVKMAHACGVDVEGEIGSISGCEELAKSTSKADMMYTNVEDAVRFVKQTEVDALAISIGTVHGMYKGRPRLDFQRVKDIRAEVKIPLVVHGGSGLSEDNFKNLVACGINKFNLYTGLVVSICDAMKETAHTLPPKSSHLPLLDAGLLRAKEVVNEHIRILGTRPLV